jgi:hypothetical protein
MRFLFVVMTVPWRRMKTLVRLLVVMVFGVCVTAGPGARADGTPAPAAGQVQDTAAAADPITGEWEGAVEMPDGVMPFSMTLKLDKDKVTGQIGNPQGGVPVSDGSFADGKVTIAFTYVDGAAVKMTGAVADGQIAGSLNYGGGQMVANWTAKRKVGK